MKECDFELTVHEIREFQSRLLTVSLDYLHRIYAVNRLRLTLRWQVRENTGVVWLMDVDRTTVCTRHTTHTQTSYRTRTHSRTYTYTYVCCDRTIVYLYLINSERYYWETKMSSREWFSYLCFILSSKNTGWWNWNIKRLAMIYDSIIWSLIWWRITFGTPLFLSLIFLLLSSSSLCPKTS